MTAPDLADALTAWRAWHLVRTDAGLRLHAIGRDRVWEPRERHTATCLRRRRWRERLQRPRAAHPAPHWDCTCGIWAVGSACETVRALDSYGRSWKPLHRVVGQVALWGEVVQHDRGWRAQYAYPTRLLVPVRRLNDRPVADVDELVEALEVYGVPVGMLGGGSRPALRRLTALAGRA